MCSYGHPDNAMLKFWDVPGVDTDLFPKDTYLSDIDVDRYDFFLLMSADRFTRNDTWLGGELHKRNKKCLFVRTNIANDISAENRKADDPNTEAVLETIRRDITDRLREHACEHVPPVFLIDSSQPDKFEFAKLQQQIIADFPEQKRASLVLSLHASSEEMIALKAVELRSGVWRSAALSGAAATVPIPGVSTAIDLGLVTREALRYFRQLGLDRRSLRRNAELHGADVDRMRAIIAKTLGIKPRSSSSSDDDDAISIESMTSIVTMIVKRSPTLVAATAVEEGVKVLPVVGCVIAPPLSFAGTRSALNLILDKFEETALQVMKSVVQSAAAGCTR